MKPIEFPEQNYVWAKKQGPYSPLPAWTDERQTISLWRLSWRERIQVLVTGRLWHRQLNFGQQLQPVVMETHVAFVPVTDDRRGDG